MPRHWRHLASDILTAISDIERFTEGMDFAAFERNKLVLLAAQRCIEIIGEAAGKLPEDITSKYPQVPWTNIRGMRNVIVHGYFIVSIPIIWKTIKEDVPSLKIAVRQILESAD